MATPADKVFAALKSAKGPGDVFRALSQDPALLVGLVVILALVLLFLRIYIWPHINPFQFNWFNDTLDWLKTATTPSGQQYPFAKVIDPTYR